MGAEWRYRRIGELGRVVTGKTPPTNDPANFGGAYPFITIPDLDGRRDISSSLRTLSDAGASHVRTSMLPAGAVMMSCIATVGRCGITTRPSFTNQQINSLICGPEFSPEYAFYCFSQLGQELNAAGSGGSVYTNVSKGRFESISVRVPPLEDQRAIASVLGALDDKIELNRKTNETLEAMARALFKSWFVDFDPVRAKAEGRAPSGMDAETAKLFPSELVESELGPIPKGWRRAPLGDLVDLVRGTTYKSALKERPGPVLLGLGSIQRNGGFRDDKLVTYGGDSPEKLRVYPGELFASLKDVTQSADLLGAVARVPPHVPCGRLTQDTVKLAVKAQTDVGEVLYRTLLTPEYREFCRQHATGTTNLGLPREDFLSYPVVVASSEVLSRFNLIARSLVSRAEVASMEMRSLALVRDTLLPGLLSGEVSVTAG